jgi:hypothetical protein
MPNLNFHNGTKTVSYLKLFNKLTLIIVYVSSLIIKFVLSNERP